MAGSDPQVQAMASTEAKEASPVHQSSWNGWSHSSHGVDGAKYHASWLVTSLTIFLLGVPAHERLLRIIPGGAGHVLDMLQWVNASRFIQVETFGGMALINVADGTFMVGCGLWWCGAAGFGQSRCWFLRCCPFRRSQLVGLRSEDNLCLHTVGLDGVRFQILLQGPSSRQEEEEHHHKTWFSAGLQASSKRTRCFHPEVLTWTASPATFPSVAPKQAESKLPPPHKRG